MTIATLLYSLVFASLVAVAAAALDALFRLGGRSTRGIWAAALCITVIGTAAAPLRVTGRPMHETPAFGAISGVVVPVSPSLADRIAQPFVMVRRLATGLADRALARMPARSPRLDRWLTAAWAAASILLLTLLAAVHAHFGRARRGWPRATLDGTDVRLAPRTGPAVIGVLTPEIVVPEWLVSRAAAERRLVLDHEREHLGARDPLVLAGACAAAALVPWHPAVWWMLARLRLAVELDCDARVLRRGVAPRRYGALLIDLAAHHPAATAGVPVLGLTLTDLERRLIAMTPHHRPFTYVRRGALAATALVAFAIACDAPVPTSVNGVQAARTTAASPTSPNFDLAALGDTTVIHIYGVVDDPNEPLSFKANGAPVFVTTDSTRMHDLNAKLEFTVMTNAERAYRITQAHGTREPEITLDPAQAVREKAFVGAMIAARTPQQQMVSRKEFNGLVLIDGKLSTQAALKQLSPQRIQTIDVLKDAAATSKYADPKAANGVISVTTKEP